MNSCEEIILFCLSDVRADIVARRFKNFETFGFDDDD